MTANVLQEGHQSPRSPGSSGRSRSIFTRNSISRGANTGDASKSNETTDGKPSKWSMGVLNDPFTHEVPGSVLLLTGERNEPLGVRKGSSKASIPSSIPSSTQAHLSSSEKNSRRQSHRQEEATKNKKLTKDGKIILEPQPDDSENDPLNWPTWKRDSALLSLGLYCMVGGGMTPILAAGFNNVAKTYNVSVPKVALTTGLYMMGMGVGSVFFSPTAILFGKRPVYLASAILFIITSVWCAASPSYNSLLVARIFQGISISPVECLPSATIAEIFFLHERAYRIGIYTLLLLGGKNLVPLVSAAIIQSYSWRWVFWIVAMVGGFCWVLLFLFVPETFWDRTPRPKSRGTSKGTLRRISEYSLGLLKPTRAHTSSPENAPVNASRSLSVNAPENAPENSTQMNIGHGDRSPSRDKQGRPRSAMRHPRDHRVGFTPTNAEVNQARETANDNDTSFSNAYHSLSPVPSSRSVERDDAPVQSLAVAEQDNDGPANVQQKLATNSKDQIIAAPSESTTPDVLQTVQSQEVEEPDTTLHNVTPVTTSPLTNTPLTVTPLTVTPLSDSSRTITPHNLTPSTQSSHTATPHNVTPLSATHAFQNRGAAIGGWPPTPALPSFNSESYVDMERVQSNYFDTTPPTQQTTDGTNSFPPDGPKPLPYTSTLKDRPQLGFIQQLKPFNGRLHPDNWFRVAIRPFILFAYPAVLWSSVVYACSVGWLIVLSESVSIVYRSTDTYNFSALSTGLIYLSPFIGGVLGTAVAGKVSDIIVRAMARRNGGLYEPEFRLVMAIPITITTVIGLMGFGWSAQVHDAWIVPTLFFGIISFGCSLGSTTAITFVVDSYRQYAGEALVTLNFSKNIFHGLVFSLFFASWLEHDGSRSVFIYLGVIQLILMFFSIPMYIFGKRARMWTARMNLMESF